MGHGLGPTAEKMVPESGFCFSASAEPYEASRAPFLPRVLAPGCRWRMATLFMALEGGGEGSIQRLTVPSVPNRPLLTPTTSLPVRMLRLSRHLQPKNHDVFEKSARGSHQWL